MHKTTTQDPLIVKWVRYMETGPNIDAGTCIVGDYIAVVGNINDRPYIALLDKNDGTIVREYIGKEKGFNLTNCVSIGDNLYAIGNFEYKTDSGYQRDGACVIFNENLDVIDKVKLDHTVYLSIAHDGNYVYLGGCVVPPMDIAEKGVERVGLIEKRALDLRLVKSKTIYRISWGSKNGIVKDVGVNPITGHIWAIGLYMEPISIHKELPRFTSELNFISILDKDLREVKITEHYSFDNQSYLGPVESICFNSSGHAYIAGSYGIAKFDAKGKLITINKKLDHSEVIAWIEGNIYVFRTKRINDSFYYVVSILDDSLNIVKEYVPRMGVRASLRIWGHRLSFDGSNIYIAGNDWLDFDDKHKYIIVVYSLAVNRESQIKEKKEKIIKEIDELLNN